MISRISIYGGIYCTNNSLQAQLEKGKPYSHGILSDILKEVLVPHRHSLLIEHNNLLEVKQGSETFFAMPKSAITLAATAVSLPIYFVLHADCGCDI